MTSRTRSVQRIWGIWRILPWEKTVGFPLLAEVLGRCRTRWGDRWKSQNRKNVYLSPFVKEPLNSKVIKSFESEQRSHYVFFVFRDPMFYLYGHLMYVSHITISWLRYTRTSLFRRVLSLYKGYKWHILNPSRWWKSFDDFATKQFLSAQFRHDDTKKKLPSQLGM